jgi:hypothetical protein
LASTTFIVLVAQGRPIAVAARMIVLMTNGGLNSEPFVRGFARFTRNFPSTNRLRNFPPVAPRPLDARTAANCVGTWAEGIHPAT